MNDFKIIEKKEFVITPQVLPFVIIPTLILGLLLGLVLSNFKTFFGFKSNSNTNQTNTNVQISENDIYDAEYVSKIYEYLENRYMGEIPPKEEVTQGIVKGIISSLDDPYTFYLDPEEAKAYLENRTGDFEGIGVTLAFNGENTYIQTVLDGSPAGSSGLMPGDIIVKVNDENMLGQLPAVVASKVKGPKDTEVKIVISRLNNNFAESKDLAIIRQKIEIDNVMWYDLGDGYVRIDIAQFVDESSEKFNQSWNKVVNDIKAKNPETKGIIVDLRNNPGGYVSSVKHVAEEFLDNGQIIMMEESRSSERVTFTDNRVGLFEDIPVVILVNEGSASASEILSAALKENKGAIIVGMPTVGKGVEQEVIDDFPDGSMLLLVFQKWLTPNGNQISKDSPIKPDHEVDFTDEDYKAGRDPQLDKAEELIKSL